MGIKNWTITAETTRSMAAREIYLNDEKHKNHINTERVINIFGDAKVSANIIANCERRKMELAKKGKGGRPPTEAMEFVLTLPKGIRPDKSQWSEMAKGVIRDIAETMKMKPSEFNNIVRGVVHQQDQNIDKRGTGDHMHIVIGKFTDEGKYMPELQQRGVLHTMKLSFNKQVRDVMGVDCATYNAKKLYKGTAKKKAPKWKVDAVREIESKIDELDRVDEMNLAYARELKKLEIHLTKFAVAVESNDARQMARQHKRASAVIATARAMQDEEGFAMSPELERAQQSVNTLIDKQNQHSKTKIQSLPLQNTKSKPKI